MVITKTYTRRSFLKAMGAAGVAGSTLSVLACQPNTTARSSGGGGSEEKALNFYIFSDYLTWDTVPRFERRSGAKVTLDLYTTNEEMLAKLQAGGSGYDLIVPSDYMVEIMVGEGMLLPLNKRKIPNLDNLDPGFRDLPYDPENEHSVPYQWGTSGILYDPEVVTEDVSGWDVMWDPRYEGKIGMLDDLRNLLGAALKRLGYSLNSRDPEQLSEAERLLMEQKPLVRGYFPSPRAVELVVGGDLALAHAYSGNAYTGIAQKETLRYVIPKEGSVLWTDTMAIPKTAPHPDVAHEFINYILDPEVGAELSNFTNFGTPNEAALPMIDEAAREDPGVYPPPEVFKRLEITQDLGEATREYERIFTEVKSA